MPKVTKAHVILQLANSKADLMIVASFIDECWARAKSDQADGYLPRSDAERFASGGYCDPTGVAAGIPDPVRGQADMLVASVLSLAKFASLARSQIEKLRAITPDVAKEMVATTYDTPTCLDCGRAVAIGRGERLRGGRCPSCYAKARRG